MSVILNALLAGLAGLVTALLILLVHKIITNKLSLIRLMKLNKGMPVWPDRRLLGNHIIPLAMTEDNCVTFQRAHEKYGPYIAGLLGDRFAMSTTDLQLIKQIVLDEMHLDRGSLDLPIAEYEQSIMLVPGAEWRRQRRVIAPAFKSNKFKVPNVLHEIDESIRKLIDHLEAKLNKNETIILAEDIAHKYSLNLVLSCLYKQDNLINFDDPKDKWTSMFMSMQHELKNNPLIKLSMVFPWFTSTLDWLIWHFHKQGVARQRIMDFVRVQTKLGLDARKQAARNEKLQGKSNFTLEDGTKFKRNMVDSIIDGYLDGKLTQKEYFNSSYFLFAAAYQTAADCIVFTFYLLSIHSQVQEQLRESIKKEGPDSEYLGWVLLESLRLMPPAPIGCTRTVDKPIELTNGMVIPAKTTVITNAYVIHRLKEYWGEDAEEFRPERWVDASQHHPLQFLAFGAGPRGCPGREFAMHHMRSLFAALLTRYQFVGQKREDAFKFTAPVFILIIPNSPTYVTIKRLDVVDSDKR